MGIKIECDNCKKNILDKNGYEIDKGKECFVDQGLPNWNKIETLAIFCSLKCLKKWVLSKEKISQ